MSRSPLPELVEGPPEEVLDEIGAAWERAQATLCEDVELHFASHPSRAWGELRLHDGTVLARLRASEAIALACGDMVLRPGVTRGRGGQDAAMAINPKQLLNTAMGVGKTVVTRGVELAEKRLRGDERRPQTSAPPSTPGTPAAKTSPSTTTRARPTSGEPSTVGAAKPGKPGGPKSATAPKPKRATKATTAKKPKRTAPAATTRDEVADVMNKNP